MKSYRDYTLGAKERASLLLKEMSLDEKMAQINCVFPFDQDSSHKRSDQAIDSIVESLFKPAPNPVHCADQRKAGVAAAGNQIFINQGSQQNNHRCPPHAFRQTG